MNESEWFSFVSGQYNKSIENADSLYPRYAVVLTAAAAVGGAHYALAINLFRNHEIDDVASLLSVVCAFLGVFCLAATLYHISYALNMSGKFRQVKPLFEWKLHRENLLNQASRKYPEKTTEEHRQIRNKYFERNLINRIAEAEHDNRQVATDRLIMARNATNNVIGAGAAALLSGALQIVILLVERT